MSDIDKIIDSIPDAEMSEAYDKQHGALMSQLALNAAAYRLQDANVGLTTAEKTKNMADVGKSIIAIKSQLDEIDRRRNGASKALKS